MLWKPSFLALFSAGHSYDVSQPLVRWIAPHNGGNNGGTKITVNGWSFSANNVNLGDDSMAGNYMILVNEAAEYECPVFNNDANGDLFECTTNPMPDGEYFVKVRVDGNWLPEEQYCGGYPTSHNCKFTVSSSNTPSIQYLTPNKGAPGQVIQLRGKIFTDMINSTTITDYGVERPQTARISKPFNGGSAASLWESQDVPYGVSMDNWNSDWGYLSMKMGGNYVGFTNVTFHVSETYGRAGGFSSAFKVSGDNKLYMFESYANIDSVSPSQISNLGGALLTISGNYFDETLTGDTQISIGGEICNVESMTMTEIKCRVPAGSQRESGFFKSNRGIYSEYVSNPGFDDPSLAWSWGAGLGSGTSRGHTEDATVTSSQGNTIEKMSFYFVAAVAGRYKFGMTSNNKFAMKVDGTEVLTGVSSSDVQWTDTIFELSDRQEVLLEAVALTSSAGSYSFAAHHLNSGFTTGQTDLANTAKHKYRIRSDSLPETQTVTFNGDFSTLNSINNNGKNPHVASVCVNCNETLVESGQCPFFKLTHKGYSSGLIYYGLGEEEFSLALASLPFYAGATVTNGTSNGCQFTYDISVNDFIDDNLVLSQEVDDLDVTVTASSGNHIPTMLIPELQGLSLKHDVSNSINRADLETEFTDLTSAFCPDGLTKWGGSDDTVWKDFEGSGNTETAFCGKKSGKNQGNVYYDGDMGFNALLENKFCFAYKGLGISSNLRIRFTYRDAQNAEQDETRNFNLGLTLSENWNYHCGEFIELLESFTGNLAVGQRILGIWFQGNGNGNYWVDNFLVTRQIGASVDEIETYLAQRVESLAPATSSISVSENSATEFEVTFTPIECATGYELIGFSSVDQVTGGANSKTYRHSGWPNGLSVTVTRNQAATTPIGGTWSANFIERNTEVNDIPANATESMIKSKFEQISGVGEVSVSKNTDLCYESKWIVTWTRAGGDVDFPTLDFSGLTGDNVASNIANMDADGSGSKVQEIGGLILDPIPASWIRRASTSPEVEVTVNNVPSVCNSCAISYTSPSHSLSAQSGDLITGNDFFVLGSGFQNDAVVFVNNVAQTTTFISATELSFTVGEVADVNTINVEIPSTGFTNEVSVYGQSSTASISVSEAGWGGHVVVTVSGTGFTENTSVQFDGDSVESTLIDYYSLTFSIPESDSVNGDYAAAVEIFDARSNNIGSFTIVLKQTLTPVITAVSLQHSQVSGEEIVINGAYNLVEKITIGDSVVTDFTQNGNSLIFTTPSKAPGTYKISVHTANGKDVSSSDFRLTYTFSLDSISPSIVDVSVMGGTTVTLTGSGFEDSTEVLVDGEPANDVTFISDTEIQFSPPTARTQHVIENTGHHPDFGEGFNWNTNSLKAKVGDTVLFKWNFQSVISGLDMRIIETLDLETIAYLENGFKSSDVETSQGAWTLECNEPGTYYFSSGCVDVGCAVVMKGTLEIEALDTSYSKTSIVSVRTNDVESSHSVNINYSTSKTPIVTEITTSGAGLNQYYLNEDLVLTGSNFGSVEPIVRLGGFPCAVSSFSSSEVTCSMQSAQQGPPIGVYQTVELEFPDKGIAVNQIMNIYNRQVVPLPTVYDVNPSGNFMRQLGHLVIDGAGFDSQAVVTIGGTPCPLITSAYNQVVCQLDSFTAGELTASVIQPSYGQNIPARCPDDNASESCSFNYIDAPSIAVVPTESISGQGFTLTIGLAQSHVDGSLECGAWDQYSESSYNPETNPSGIQDASDACVRIFVGKERCVLDSVVTSGANHLVNCTLAEPPKAGSNNLLVIATANGAFETATVQSAYVVDNHFPIEGSIFGGATVTISGSGFCDMTTVSVSDANGNCIQDSQGQCTECQVSSVTPTQILCELPGPMTDLEAKLNILKNGMSTAYPELSFSYNTATTPSITDLTVSNGSRRKRQAEVISASGGTGDVLEITGFGWTNDQNAITILTGDAECSILFFSETNIECEIGSHEAGDVAVIFRDDFKGLARLDMDFEFVLDFYSIDPSFGSFGGNQLLTLSGSGFNENSTTVQFCGYDVAEFESFSNSDIVIKTLPRTYASDGSGWDVDQCTVAIHDGTVTKTTASFGGSYTYSHDYTAVITSIDNIRGGTAGGTRLTINGRGFAMDNSSAVEVSIDGSICDVQTITDTEITCLTNAHEGSGRFYVAVNIPGLGHAYIENDVQQFYYIDRWSSIYTWGGTTVPTAGDMVIIPAGQTILIDTQTDILKLLLIDGGKVIFDDELAAPEIQAEQILITNGGILEIGTADEPYMGDKAIITLHGHPRQLELPVFGTKVLGVYEGHLEMHGRPVHVPWTLLAETANAGDTEIKVQVPVGDWQAGDRIAIASTGGRNSQNENEDVEIQSVSADGLTVTLAEPLGFTHYGYTDTLQNGQTIEMRAEVGLLTHNILFRGNNDPQWNDPIQACPDGFNVDEHAIQTCFLGRFGEETGTNQYGAHIMIHPNEAHSGDAVAHIENVELNYVGQAFRIGRYPMHWHRCGDVAENSYFRHNSIHQAFNRAHVFHHTNGVLFEFNVVYNTMGGSIFIEDGIEENNILQNNLIIFTKGSSSLVNDDVTPASMWITNPNNIVRNNHIASSTHFGYWYRMNEHPDGASFRSDYCQQRMQFGEFSNNTAHSCGWIGLWTFEKYFPHSDPERSCWSNDLYPAIFRDSVFWRCHQGVEFVDVGAVQGHRIVVADVMKSGIEWKRVYGTVWGEGGAYLKDCTIAANTITNPLQQEERGLVMPDSSGLIVDGVDFVGWDRAGHAIGGAFIVCICTGPHCGGWEWRFKNIRWFSDSGTHRKIKWRWASEAVVVDIDGSLLGLGASKKFLKQQDFQVHEGCDSVASSDELQNGPHWLCDRSEPFFRVAMNAPKPAGALGLPLHAISRQGAGQFVYRETGLTKKSGWGAVVRGFEEYELYYDNYYGYNNISYSMEVGDMAPGDAVRFKHFMTKTPDVIKFGGTPREPLDHVPDYTLDNNFDWFFNETERMFYYLVKNDDPVSRKKRRARSLGASKDDDYKTIQVKPESVRCFFADCITPPDPATIPPTMERPKRWDLLSEVTWTEKSDTPWGLTFKVPDGPNTGARKRRDTSQDPPIEGDNLFITAEMWLVWDEGQEFPVFDTIIIEGVIEVENPNTKLQAKKILVSGGRIIVGWNDTTPYDGELFEIVLHGDEEDEQIDLADGIVLGTKALGCFGGCSFHGQDRSVYQTKLLNSVYAGETTLSLENVGDMQAGDQLMITSTFYDFVENEIVTIASVDVANNEVTLTAGIQYDHEVVAFTTDGTNFRSDCQVALLTRNIKIRGIVDHNNDTPQNDGSLLGARVLVGPTQLGYPAGSAKGYNGFGAFTNVEFVHMGQWNFIDVFDPRYGVAYLMAGNVDDIMPSVFVGNSMHQGYGGGLGVFQTNNLVVQDNVIHRTYGHSMKLAGLNCDIQRNIFAWNQNQERYLDMEGVIEFLPSSVDIEEVDSENIIFSDNVIVGSDRAGLRSAGILCTSNGDHMVNNVIRTAWIGVVGDPAGMLHDSTCSLYKNLHISRILDGAIVANNQLAKHIEDCTIMDAAVGVFTYTINGVSWDAKATDIRNTKIVGYTPGYDCTRRSSLSAEMTESLAKFNKRGVKDMFSGRVGVVYPQFDSSDNMSPEKADYTKEKGKGGGISGLTVIENVSMINFNNQCGEDAIISWIPGYENVHYPIHVTGLNRVNSPAKSIFVPRPSIGRITVEDMNCIDMECDGMKHFFITDFDGGLFGGSGGTLVPEMEYGWDNTGVGPHSSRGLGDYRIPTHALTDPANGDRINTTDYCPNKGIIRENTCSFDSDMQAFFCPGDYDYMQLTFKSKDFDSETRRIGPLAVISETGYVELVNGPKKTDWGLRKSNYHSIVKAGYHYDTWFTSTPPQVTSIKAQNGEGDIRISIWFPHPQRMDVYSVDEATGEKTLIVAENMEIIDGNMIPKVPVTRNEFVPAIGSAHGSNYQVRDEQIVYITLTGDADHIEIHTAPVVLMSFGFPPVNIDDFFEENLINNLAAFFGLPPRKVRIVNVVRENGRKKRDTWDYGNPVHWGVPRAIRDTSSSEDQPPKKINLAQSWRVMAETEGEAQITVEVGDTADETATSVQSGDDSGLTSAEQLTDLANEAASGFQAGSIEAAIGTPIAEFGISTVLPESDSQAWNDTVIVMDNELAENGTISTLSIDLTVIDVVELDFAGTVFPQGDVFAIQPRVRMISAAGQHMMTLGTGHENQTTWQMSVASSDPASVLTGTTTVDFGEDGWFTFTDLAIDTIHYEGLYLRFQVGPYPVNSDKFVDSSTIFIRDEFCRDENCPFGYTTCDSVSCECLDEPSLIDFKNHTSVDCTGITVKVDLCAIYAARMDPADFFMAGINSEPTMTPADATAAAIGSNTCVGEIDYLTNDLSFTMINPLYDCGTVITTDGDHHNLYSNAIQGRTGSSSGVITRERSMKLDFTCKMQQSAVVSAGMTAYGLEKYMSESRLGESYPVTLDLFNDDTFTTGLDPSFAIWTPDYINFAVTADLSMDTDTNYKMYIDECWATGSPDSADAQLHNFWTGGCPAADAVDFSGNGLSNSVQVQVESFIWDDGNSDIYLHCAVTICNPATHDCTPNCSRKKRSLSAAVNEMKIVSTKLPVKLIKNPSENPCDTTYCKNADCKMGWKFMYGLMGYYPTCECREGTFAKNTHGTVCDYTIDTLPTIGEVTVVEF